MSDFLARLAERTLGQMPGVQPLLVSRFAPAPPSPDFPAAPEGALAAATVPETNPASTTLAHLPGRISGRSPHDALVETGLQGSRTSGESPILREDSEGKPAKQDGGRFVAAVPIEPTPTANDHAQGQSKPATPGLSASVLHALSPAIDTVDTRGSGIGDRPFVAGQTFAATPLTIGDHAPEGARSAADSGLPIAAGGGFASALTARDMIEENRPAPAESIADRRIAAQPPQRSGLAGNSSQVAVGLANDDERRGAERVLQPPTQSASLTPALSQADAAPVIRVTIGRIEVRAVIPPAPAARPATPSRPSSVLSLDDYLKRGHGEKQ